MLQLVLLLISSLSLGFVLYKALRIQIFLISQNLKQLTCYFGLEDVRLEKIVKHRRSAPEERFGLFFGSNFWRSLLSNPKKGSGGRCQNQVFQINRCWKSSDRIIQYYKFWVVVPIWNLPISEC